MDSYCSECVKETSVPSFSSTLLDSIYHSIEEVDEKMVLYNETMKKKNTSSYERASRVEKWMENQVGKKSALDFERKRLRNDNALLIKSSSSGSGSGSGSGSSDSSSGGGFSSSETESIGHGVSSKPMGSCYGLPKPKPVKKTEKFKNFAKNINVGQERRDLCDLQAKPKSETNFMRSKSSRGLRIYGDLKKVKQPISPGGKVSSFFNYLFAAGNTKKTSNNEMGLERSPKSANVSNCSTPSSFSRSCMSNSRGKSSNGNKRTVRFYPVSVIVDEDCQPCGEKKLYDRDDEDKGLSRFRPNAINNELKTLGIDKDCRVDKAARSDSEYDRREFKGLSQFRLNAINEELKSLAMDKDRRVDEDARAEREFDRREFKGLSQFRLNAINEELKSLAMDKDRRVDKAARAEREFDRREFKGLSQFRLNAINEELKSLAMDKDRGVDKAARAEREFDKREFRIRSQEFGQANDEDEDEDDESCASSDLFELDNLSAIGNGNMDMYRQELPVYETTRVHSNTHMTNGLKHVKIEAIM